MHPDRGTSFKYNEGTVWKKLNKLGFKATYLGKDSADNDKIEKTDTFVQQMDRGEIDGSFAKERIFFKNLRKVI